MSNMRAKMMLGSAVMLGACEVLRFHAVAKNEAYPADGSDEDNTFAKFSPSATCEITVANPALIGQFKTGEKYYVDFTLVEAVNAPAPTPVPEVAPVSDNQPPVAGETSPEDAPPNPAPTDAATDHPELSSDAPQV